MTDLIISSKSISLRCTLSARAKHNGPYSQKRNNFSPGISLTSQTWFWCSPFVLQAIFAAEKVEYCKENIYKRRHVYFTNISLYIMNKNKNKTINNLLCQTYSWNKGGLKLFRFREYWPLFLIHGSISVSKLSFLHNSWWGTLMSRNFLWWLHCFQLKYSLICLFSVPNKDSLHNYFKFGNFLWLHCF